MTTTTTTTPKPGDIVQVLDGDFAGCILTLLSIDGLGRYVCENKTYGSDVKADTVRLYRAKPAAGWPTNGGA